MTNFEELLSRPVTPDTAKYLRKLECSKPTEPGMYLHLYHGRTDPESMMDGWGEDGPFFGPLEWFSCTYMGVLNLQSKDDDEPVGPLCGSVSDLNEVWHRDAMFVIDDLIYYDGVFYGDWSLDHFEGQTK